jgi:DNA-binding XRE family transcriptional regulator
VNKPRYKENLPKRDEKQLKKEFSVAFGKYIQQVRKEHSLTQEELAFKTNLHSTYIGHIETGTYTPSIFVVWKISQVLKLNLSALLLKFKF